MGRASDLKGGQEYEEISEFNQSLKMSMVINKPIYEKKDGLVGGPLKKNQTMAANPTNTATL